MTPNFGDKETEKLAAEIAKLAGESEEEAVRQALLERREHLQALSSGKKRRPRTKEEILHFMETEIWPLLPARNRGGSPITKEEKEKILYGPEGF
jgi:antitoxin VapB